MFPGGLHVMETMHAFACFDKVIRLSLDVCHTPSFSPSSAEGGALAAMERARVSVLPFVLRFALAASQDLRAPSALPKGGRRMSLCKCSPRPGGGPWSTAPPPVLILAPLPLSWHWENPVSGGQGRGVRRFSYLLQCFQWAVLALPVATLLITM